MASFVTSQGTIEPETPAEMAQFVWCHDSGGWAMVGRRCLVEWVTNLPSLLPIEDLGLGGTVARDRSDASYDRPPAVPEA